MMTTSKAINVTTAEKMMQHTTIKRKMLKFGTLNWQKKTKTLTITYVAVTDIS